MSTSKLIGVLMIGIPFLLFVAVIVYEIASTITDKLFRIFTGITGWMAVGVLVTIYLVVSLYLILS